MINKFFKHPLYSYAGRIRDYNITKREWVLDGATVLYGSAAELRATPVQHGVFHNASADAVKTPKMQIGMEGDVGIPNGEKMKTVLLIVSCLMAVMLTTNATVIQSPSVENNESNLSAGNQNHTEPEGNDISDTAESPLSESPLDRKFSVVPDFLYGYLDYGTYSTPSRISNPDQYDEINISADNTLDFPELSVLAVLVHKWGFSPYLMEQEDAKIEKLFELLKVVKIQKEEDIPQNGDQEQDSEISVVFVTGSANYALAELRSLKDDSIYIRINQENMSDVLLLSSKSEELHTYLREICGIQRGDIQLLSNADTIMYLSADDEWVTLPDSKAGKLKSMTDGIKKIPNYSTGCPFELKLIIEKNGVKYDAAISTDSCGIIIIGDQTYQVEKSQRDAIRSVFENVSWDGG